MSKKNQIQIEFKVINSEFNRAMKEMGSEVSNLNKKFRLEQEQLRVNGTEKEKLQSRMSYLTERYKLQQKEVQATKKHLEKAKQVYGENSKEVQQLENRLLEAQRKEAYFANEIELTNRKLAEHTDKMKVASNAFKDFGGKMQEIGKTMTDIGKSMTTKVTLPIVGVGTAVAKLGIDFEKSMSEVQSVTGASADEMEILEDAAREAGATTNKSAREAAEALKYMGLAGWSVTDSQKALMPILKLSSAGNMELGRTSDLVTDSMSAMGIEIDDLERYLDVLAQTSRNSNTDIDQLGEAFITAGGKMRDLGISFEEGAVALGLMADAGLKGSEAGRGLSAILTNLTSPTGQAKKAMDELGISVFDANGEFIGIEEALKVVDGAMEGLTQEQQVMYKSMIAGKEHSKTFSALMNSLGDDFDKLKNDVQNANGALETMYAISTDNTKGKLDELKSSLEELALKFYEGMQRPLGDIIDKLKAFADRLNELSPTQIEFIIQILAIAAAIGPLLLVLGALFSAIGNIATGISFLLTPAGLVLVGIGLLIAAGVALYLKWEEVSEFLKGIWDSIVETFMSALQAIQDFMEPIVTAITTFFITAWEYITIPFKLVWEIIKSVVMSTLAIVEGIIGTVLNVIKAIWQTIWNYIGEYVTKVWNNIKKVITTVINAISSVINTVLNTIRNIFTTIWNAILSITTTLWNGIKTAISVPINAAKNIISTVVNGIKTTMSNVFNGIKNTTANVFNNIKTAMTKPVEAAKDSISRALEAIKGFFSRLRLKFPKIEMPKLPKFEMTGKFGLNPPSVPKLSVRWNALGAIFTKPTIFDTSQGLQGVGEAGPEAILPISHLADMIRDIIFPKWDSIGALAEGNVVVNFNGNYQFRDEDDINHFMNRAELMMKRRGI